MFSGISNIYGFTVTLTVVAGYSQNASENPFDYLVDICTEFYPLTWRWKSSFNI